MSAPPAPPLAPSAAGEEHRKPPGERLRALAVQILSQEADRAGGPGRTPAAVQAAFARLHELLEDLIGAKGFGALLARAVNLAGREHAWLSAVEIAVEDGLVMKHLDRVAEQQGDTHLRDGAAALLATLVGLLFTFIGEPLTLRLLGRIWDVESGPAGAAPEET